jgi:antitoxin YefM
MAPAQQGLTTRFLLTESFDFKYKMKYNVKYREGGHMTLALTQSDFRANLKKYLDQVNDEDETIYIARSNRRAVAIISQEKLDWLERALKAKEDSLEYAIARDQLIKRHVLPDDEIVASNDDYWNQFKA